MLDGMRRLSQEEAARVLRVLGVCEWIFRRYVNRYREMGLSLSHKRLTNTSFRRAPVDEVMAVADQYERCYQDCTVKHFYSRYSRYWKAEGQRSYRWVKNTVQSSGWFPRFPNEGVCRKHRERSPLPQPGILRARPATPIPRLDLDEDVEK
jgi:hypothetical protein